MARTRTKSMRQRHNVKIDISMMQTKPKQRKHKVPKSTKKAMDLDAVVKAKWKSEYDKDPAEFVKKSAALAAKPMQARLLRIENGAPIFYMICVGCKKDKPALPSFFRVNNGEARIIKGRAAAATKTTITASLLHARSALRE
jgi:hypothetical protein